MLEGRRKGGEKNAGGEGREEGGVRWRGLARMCHFDWIFFFHVRRNSFAGGVARARALARAFAPRALCPHRDIFKSAPPRIAPAIAAVRESHNGLDTTSDSSAQRRQPGGQYLRNAIHRRQCTALKWARIDNPMASRSIPYMHNTHTHVREGNRYPRARLLFFYMRTDAGRNRGGGGCNDWGNKGGEDGDSLPGRLSQKVETSQDPFTFCDPILARYRRGLSLFLRVHNVYFVLWVRQSAPRIVNGKDMSSFSRAVCIPLTSLTVI